MKSIFIILISLFLSFQNNSNKGDSKPKDKTIEGDQFIQLLDKPITDSKVKSFLNDTSFHFIIYDPIFNSKRGITRHGATLALMNTRYESADKSIELIISDDTLGNIMLHSNYRGKLPYKLSWQMTD